MLKSQKSEGFEKVLEEIVFDKAELEELKIAVENFNKGIITAKELKQNLLQCRGRIVKDISNFLVYCLNRDNSNQSGLEGEQLRRELLDRNELLEVVAKKINALALKAKKKLPVETESLSLEGTIKIEIERVFSVIRADEWLDMCGYDDYKFFVKLYNKLQTLYRQKFGDEEKKSKNAKVEQEIMAGKIVKLNFPEEVTTELIRFIAIRNNATHDNYDLTSSDMEVAHNAFIRLFIYFIATNLNAQLLTENRKAFYNYLHQYFSSKLENNSRFLEKMKKNLNSLFNNFR